MSQEPWGDIPLFREIQRILSSSEGPVNTEIATQVASAVASQDGDPPPDAGRGRELSDAVHQAEMMLAGYTRLAVDEPASVRVLGRTEWARDTLAAWRWIFEHLAGRFTGALGGETGEDAVDNPGLAAAMGQVAPLLVGIQVGTLVGHLAPRALTRYDHPIPREDDGRLLFVDPNIAGIARDYAFDNAAFLRWLAFESVARHLVLRHAPWINRYWRSLIVEVVDAMEIDVGELQARMSDLQSQGPEALQEGFGSGTALPVVPTERHRAALSRLRSFVAAIEGYARHAVTQVGSLSPDDDTQIEEGMARRKRDQNEGESMLEALLGVSFDHELEAAGATFCAAVVKLRGIAALNTMWAAPDNLPSYEEIRDPFQWMERILDEG